ncbi:hypothetical protein [Agromyces allii]|uniref:Uncharacterized protein n=1 Tax=Agromyces allii TaxID=393607 RepID=A0ABN2PZ77_9MICO|nr:hypothetical protein [Agromyces allii]
MAAGYRSVLRLGDQVDAVATAESQLRSWLAEKARGRSALVRADWDGAGAIDLGAAARLIVTHADRAEDSSRRRLYRLEETNAAGTFIVSVFALSLPHAHEDRRQTLVIDVAIEGTDDTDVVDRVDPPRLVTALLETVDAWDGSTRLSGKPRAIRSADVRELLDAITDPERSATVIVAGSLGPETDEVWSRTVESLTKQSVGVASTFVVYADAMEEVLHALPPSHEVRPGSVRTYAPRVELDDPDDGVRHRFLGPATLARSVAGTRVARPLTKIHAAAARRRLVEQDLPADIRRGVDLLRKAAVTQERLSKVDRIVATARETLPVNAAGSSPVVESTAVAQTQAMTGAAQVPVSESLVAKLAKMVRRWFDRELAGVDDLEALDALLTTQNSEVAVAVEQLDEAADRQLQLEAELRDARVRLEELDLELALVTDDLREAARETQILRRNLILADRAEDTHVGFAPVEWQAPTTVEELVARITSGEEEHVALERVVFTGDVDAALEVDKRDPHGRYAAALWDYVHVLYDYVGARTSGDLAGNVHTYLTDDRVDGYKCSPERHAGTESESVLSNRAWREERVLPVPGGKVLMDAHFKPTHRDTFAPRMHYHDDVAESGRVYIGYIGRHLSNTKS